MTIEAEQRCWICYEDEPTLIRVCKCKGSIAVHEQCVIKYIAQGKIECPLCHYKFQLITKRNLVTILYKLSYFFKRFNSRMTPYITISVLSFGCLSVSCTYGLFAIYTLHGPFMLNPTLKLYTPLIPMMTITSCIYDTSATLPFFLYPLAMGLRVNPLISLLPFGYKAYDLTKRFIIRNIDSESASMPLDGTISRSLLFPITCYVAGTLLNLIKPGWIPNRLYRNITGGLLMILGKDLFGIAYQLIRKKFQNQIHVMQLKNDDK